ncbi:hypothetical protein [Microbacterium sp. NPDC089696]|uniref:hypothetical protein n=1 Tax=Microbacterium sp. NPDC089696 TaxID=3364199 RepID=UPI0037FFD70D
MTQTAETATTHRIPWMRLTVATILAVGTVALLWLVAVPVGPVVCPAIYPAPLNCFAGNREGSALIMTLVVVALYVLTLLAAILPPRAHILTTAGVVLLAIAPFVSYAVVAWSPGFAL